MADGEQGAPRAIDAVGAVLVSPAGQVLLVRRGRPPARGSWSLPGGKVEPDESYERAVLREVLEETGVSGRVVCALGVVTVAGDGHVYAIHEHLVEPLGASAARPRAGDDADDARWTAYDALAGLGVSAQAIAVIELGLEEARRRGLLLRGGERT